VKRRVPPPAGSISVVPAGLPSRWRPSGSRELLHVYLEPGLVAHVAAQEFDLDPARLAVPPIDGLDLPPVRAAMAAVGDELTGGAGGRLAAESLANVLAVQLIRHALTPHVPRRRRDGVLPRRRLRSVQEYVEGSLDGDLSLARMAAAAGLSPHHFARQFRAATGQPPHQYVIARRVERARQILTAEDLTLADVALQAGFSDQSQLTHHFKRLVGVTPGQFRRSARNA
jgi:AraC family transcriptional regulator